MNRMIVVGLAVAGLAACQPAEDPMDETTSDASRTATTTEAMTAPIPEDAIPPEESVPADLVSPREQVETPPMPSDPEMPGAPPPAAPEGQ